MTENELLEKLYEGALTAEEHQTLDARMAQSPEFAAEVQDFLAVVQLLHTEKKEDRVDTAFLETTREKVAALIATAGATAIAGSGAVTQSGGTSILTAKFVQWAVVALGTLGVGTAVVWNLMDSPSTPTVQQLPVVQPLSSLPPESLVVQGQPSVADNRTQESLVADQQAGRKLLQPDQHSGIAANRPAGQRSQSDRLLGATEKPSTEDTDAIVPSGAIANANEGDQKTYEMELDHYNQRLRQLKALKDTQGQAKVLNDIANTERLMQKYETAIFHADQSVQLWKQLGEVDGIIASYRTLGMVYREAGNANKAETVLSTGLGLAQTDNLKEQRGLILGELSKVYEAQGNKRLAYEKMNAAVILLRQTDSEMLRVWEEELKRLELSMK